MNFRGVAANPVLGWQASIGKDFLEFQSALKKLNNGNLMLQVSIEIPQKLANLAIQKDMTLISPSDKDSRQTLGRGIDMYL